MNEYTIEEIKKHLDDLEISQPTMANAIFVSKDWVNRILNGRTKCSSRMKTKMCVFIDTELKKKN